MDVNDRIASRLRAFRGERGLSLEALAERSGVSRSAISLIERGGSSPTAVVLDRLATALGIALPALFDAPAVPAAPPSPLQRKADQATWTDPDTGYARRALSPPTGAPLSLVEVRFPAGKRLAYDTAARDADLHQQIWMLEGEMEFTVGPTRWRLAEGDCLAMRLDAPIVFRNPTRRPARYLVAVATLPFTASPS